MFKQFLTGLAVAAMISPVAANADEFTYGSWVGPKHLINTIILPTLFEDIEKNTNGEVAWKLVSGGALFPAREALASTGRGMADASATVPSFVTNSIPVVATINELQYFGDNPLAILGATEETVLLNCPGCLEDFRKHNLVYLGSTVTSAFRMMCTEPYKTVADLKGVKVRSSGATGGWAKHLQMTPVKMTSGELVEGLQRGQIDCTFGPVAWLKSFSLFDTVKHVVDTPMGITRVMSYLFMNRDSWDSVSAENRQGIVNSLARSSYRGIVDGYDAQDQVAIGLAKEAGVTFEAGGADFDTALESYRAKALPQIIERAKKRGVENPEALIETYFELEKKWSKITEETGGERAAFIKALQDEIYSKVDPEKL